MKRRAAMAVLGPLLLSCRAPWTVRRIEDTEAAGAPAQQDGRRFDAAGYVQSIWDARVLPAASQAVSFDEWRRGHAVAAQMVKGGGRVVRAEPARLLIDVPPYDGQADLILDIGTSIRGTALRDALPFIQFSQFVNQVDFAKVAGALNARAAKSAEAALPAEGAGVSFAGAAAIPSDHSLPEIVPVILTLSRERG
jgi:predicted lipoprotein